MLSQTRVFASVPAYYNILSLRASTAWARRITDFSGNIHEKSLKLVSKSHTSVNLDLSTLKTSMFTEPMLSRSHSFWCAPMRNARSNVVSKQRARKIMRFYRKFMESRAGHVYHTFRSSISATLPALGPLAISCTASTVESRTLGREGEGDVRLAREKDDRNVWCCGSAN